MKRQTGREGVELAQNFDQVLGLRDEIARRVEALAQPFAADGAQAASILTTLKTRPREVTPLRRSMTTTEVGGADDDEVARCALQCRAGDVAKAALTSLKRRAERKPPQHHHEPD